MTVAVDANVFEFDVAVDGVLVMDEFHCVKDTANHVPELTFSPHRPVAHDIECLLSAILHDKDKLVLGGEVVHELRDVSVLEGLQSLEFLGVRGDRAGSSAVDLRDQFAAVFITALANRHITSGLTYVHQGVSLERAHAKMKNEKNARFSFKRIKFAGQF